jgi:hypothetical protein
MSRDKEAPQLAITALKIVVNNVIGLSWAQFPGKPFEYGGM